MEAIKHSKIIIVLLILYIGISIIVVTLDKSQKKSKSSSSGTKEVDKKAIEDFLDEIENINSKVILYVNEHNIVDDKCIPLSNVFEDESYTGSVYVSSNNTSMRLWYSNGKYAVNNIEIEEQDVTENDIEDGYTTEYHDSCGLTL